MILEAAGGLGNQLFIWNLAHLIQDQTKMKVFIAFPAGNKERPNQLSALTEICPHNIKIVETHLFNLTLKINDKFSAKIPKSKKLINAISGIKESGHPENVIELEELSKRSIVRGFHQDANLVKKGWPLYEKELQDVVNANANSARCRLLLDHDEWTKKVNAIHIRRGDYVENQEVIGCLGLNYYKRALDIVEMNSNYVFSDSEYVSRELDGIIPVAGHYSPKETSAWETLALLGTANSIIMANSTLSWWAGLVGLSRGSKVLAPKPWTRGKYFSETYLNDERFRYLEAEFNNINERSQP